MTVATLLDSMSSRELQEWRAYFTLRGEALAPAPPETPAPSPDELRRKIERAFRVR